MKLPVATAEKFESKGVCVNLVDIIKEGYINIDKLAFVSRCVLNFDSPE